MEGAMLLKHTLKSTVGVIYAYWSGRLEGEALRDKCIERTMEALAIFKVGNNAEGFEATIQAAVDAHIKWNEEQDNGE